MPDDLIILNEGLRSTTSKSGKTRFHIKITAEPLVINTSKETIGGPVAAAIAHHLRERIRGISAVASAATLKYREKAQRAFKRGAPWAMRLYAGGRTGAMEPNQTNRAFNDSGRMEKTIVATADNKGNWRVNVASNRLSGDPASVQRIYQKLVQYVPEIANPALLMQNDIIRRTLEQAQRDMIKKARATTGKLQVGLAKALFQTARQIVGIGNGLAG